MYLVDTNVWLERLLDQERSEEVGQFIDQVPSEHLYITDFAFHSIALILCRLNRKEVLLSFVRDAFIEGAVILLHLDAEDTHRVLHHMERSTLDFDDAYQYSIAESYELTLISFDSDFDRTQRGRKTPGEILPPEV